MGQHRFPRKKAEKNTYYRGANNYLIENQVRLTINETYMLTLAALMVLWGGSYPESSSKLTKTSANIATTNSLIKQIEAHFRLIFGDIPKSALTIEDRFALNLPILDLEPTPAPIPPNAPELKFVKKDYLWVQISITDPQKPDSLGKPEGVFETEIVVAILEAGEVKPVNFPQTKDFNHEASTGKHLIKLSYELEMIGSTIYYRARYINTRKQFGPWSPLISWIVS